MPTAERLGDVSLFFISTARTGRLPAGMIQSISWHRNRLGRLRKLSSSGLLPRRDFVTPFAREQDCDRAYFSSVGGYWCQASGSCSIGCWAFSWLQEMITVSRIICQVRSALGKAWVAHIWFQFSRPSPACQVGTTGYLLSCQSALVEGFRAR